VVVLTVDEGPSTVFVVFTLVLMVDDGQNKKLNTTKTKLFSVLEEEK
jgi:hypothetical protein